MVSVKSSAPQTGAKTHKEPTMNPRTIAIIDPRPRTWGPRRLIRLSGLRPACRDKVRDG